ncbi:MAG: response regulator [Deltaproteobacteria bacterium]|nr:response regulator [Deltaproteobacteria bacterium]
MEDVAILITADGSAGLLRGLVERLSSGGITTTVVDELPVAVELSNRAAVPPCILVDLRDTAGGEIEDAQLAAQAIRRVVSALPHTSPVAVLAGSNVALAIACIRAGAGDVIDLEVEGTAAARVVVHRIWERQRGRTLEAEALASQRSMIEELLRDLIRTERRTIEAEDKLAAQNRRSSGEHVISDMRPPAVLLVEHDRDVADELADLLEAAGIATFAYVTGEEALREAGTLASTNGLDLALVAAQLPGMDGLETIRRLRDRVPGLAAFLITSVIEAELAANAADLGVVGFVQKPLADLQEVVDRLAQLAHESLTRTREQAYLQRIKERHERVLARYRALPREQ